MNTSTLKQAYLVICQFATAARMDEIVFVTPAAGNRVKLLFSRVVASDWRHNLEYRVVWMMVWMASDTTGQDICDGPWFQKGRIEGFTDNVMSFLRKTG